MSNKEIINYIITKAQKMGATEAEASFSVSSGFELNTRLEKLENFEYTNGRQLALTVYFDKHFGSATTNDFSLPSLDLAIEKACTIASFSEEDPACGLADKNLLAFDYPELELYHPWKISTTEAIALTQKCEHICLNNDKRIVNSEGCSFSTHESYYIYGNSDGFIGSYRSTMHRMECLLIAEDKNGMQSDGDFTMARTNTDLLSIEELAKKAIKNVVKKLSPQKLTTQKCAILFDPTCAKSLLGALLSAISGENLYQQSSFLLNCLDTKIFPDFINIDERPHLLGEIGSTPFDSEGVATQAKYFVKDGILTNYLLNSYTARKLGMQTTGNAGGISNLFINSTSQNFAELLKLMGTGLFVTDVFGQGVNIITGDYSRGAFGFWVENGEIKYPVHEITIAGNIKNMFQNIIAVGKDVDNRGSIKTGSILIADMSVAGN